MKRILFSVVFIFSSLLFISCQKDNSSVNNSSELIGDWKLVSVEAHITNTSQYNELGTNYKTVTVTEYTTVDNTGEMKVEKDKMSTVNMSYRISTISEGQYFEDGMLIDNYDFPFEYTVPEFNSTATYKNVGADSIYFDSGSLFFVQSGSTTPSNPSGMKYILQDNKLKFYTNYTELKTELVQGVPMQVRNDANVAVNFEKK